MREHNTAGGGGGMMEMMMVIRTALELIFMEF